ATNFEFAGFGKEIPEQLARFLNAQSMQIKTAFERNLAGLEFAHLAFLHAVASPVELVLGRHVDHELIGQAVDTGFAVAERGVGAAEIGRASCRERGWTWGGGGAG